MISISNKHVVTEFGAEAVITVCDGDEVLFETQDCYGGILLSAQKDALLLRKAIRDKLRKNENIEGIPVTGPIRITGALPGDTLRIDIIDITVSNTAAMCIYPEKGAMKKFVKSQETQEFTLDNNTVTMFGQSIPLKPMIGVIGLAPAPDSGKVKTLIPGKHGGNMDCKLITAGASVYLPVKQDGAMLALGDVHARMGDGEVALCGLECGAKVKLKVSVISKICEEWPVLHSEGYWYVLTSAGTLDEAVEIAKEQLFYFIRKRTDYMDNEILMLMSIVGELSICQIVNPLLTVRMGIPEQIVPLFK